MPARRLPFLHYCHSLLPITINRNRTQQPRRTNELAPHTHPPWHFPHPVTFCTTSNFTNLFGTNYYNCTTSLGTHRTPDPKTKHLPFLQNGSSSHNRTTQITRPRCSRWQSTPNGHVWTCRRSGSSHWRVSLCTGAFFWRKVCLMT